MTRPPRRYAHTVRGAIVAVGTLFTIAVAAGPAGAQQLVDAGKEGDGSGGLAFVLMTFMFFVIAFSLLYMDRIRRRAGEEDSTD